MIAGHVSDRREAAIDVTVGSPCGMGHGFRAIIDTGFTRYLTLPAASVASLGLPFREFVQVVLADGGVTVVEAYDGVVQWHGEPRAVLVYAIDGGPLLGMSMLYGSRVTLDVVDGGTVTIEPLPQPR